MKDIEQQRCGESDSQNQSEAAPANAFKRTLLKMTWVAPVIVAVSLPRSGYAANISGNHPPPEPKSNNGNHFGQVKQTS